MEYSPLVKELADEMQRKLEEAGERIAQQADNELLAKALGENKSLDDIAKKLYVRSLVLESLLSKYGLEIPADDGLPVGEIESALNAVAMQSCHDIRTQAAYLRLNGWIMQELGTWKDPMTTGSMVTNEGVRLQIKRGMEPFKHLMKKINPHDRTA